MTDEPMTAEPLPSSEVVESARNYPNEDVLADIPFIKYSDQFSQEYEDSHQPLARLVVAYADRERALVAVVEAAREFIDAAKAIEYDLPALIPSGVNVPSVLHRRRLAEHRMIDALAALDTDPTILGGEA